MRLSTLVVSSIAMTGLLSGVGLSLCFGTTAGPEPPILISSPLPKPAAERELLNRDFPEVPLQLAQATGSTTSPPSTTLLKYSDQKPDGRKSIAGTGEMIRFELPSAEQRVRAIKIHGSRYGDPRPPAEDFVLRFLNEDMSEVLHERKAPYSLFKRGNAEWVTVRFDQPLKLSKVFWVAVNFNAERTKGVYVSYDSSTAGKYSRVGWPPEQPGEEPGFEGDWMIEAVLTREGATPPGEG